MTGRFPLTDFIIAIGKASRSALARTDTAKAAAKYGVDPQHAAGLIRLRIMMGE